MTLYDRDFHAWANEQAALARSRAHNRVDWENVAEELESLGKQQASELNSRFRILLLHLLEWRYQPNLQGHSWRSTIKVQRRDIARHLGKNPSLMAIADAEFVDAYEGARLDAVVETGFPERTFPDSPPFTRDQAMDDDFWPEPSERD